MKYRMIKDVDILRPADGSDTGGRSSASDLAIVLIVSIEDGADVIDESSLYIHVGGSACYIVKTKDSYFFGETLGADKLKESGRDIGFGGNFLWSEDKRFQAICGYPIPIHD